MIKFLKNINFKIHDSATQKDILNIKKELAKIHFNQGVILEEFRINKNKKKLVENEYKVFSQFGDDGIIQFLINELKIDDIYHQFIEFGIENYEESNTRFLLQFNNWRGLILDGSENNIEYAKNNLDLWKYDITAHSAFVTKDNVNNLFIDNGFSGKIGLLSIDIDGNDYWVWEAIDSVDPIIVICEYNSHYGPDLPLTIPYYPDFHRNNFHSSNKYWGASISALTHLAKKKNYSLVGSNSAGNNCYFVKNDYMKSLNALLSSECWRLSKFRETRNGSDLIGMSIKQFYESLSDLEFVNVIDNKKYKASEFLDKV